jgi:hypothetical protein
MRDQDNFRVATIHTLSGQTTSKCWFLVGICEVKRNCSYLPAETLRPSSSKQFLPRQSARGLHRNPALCLRSAKDPSLRSGFRLAGLTPPEHLNFSHPARTDLGRDLVGAEFSSSSERHFFSPEAQLNITVND